MPTQRSKDLAKAKANGQSRMQRRANTKSRKALQAAKNSR
jgi:hypothetical protein